MPWAVLVYLSPHQVQLGWTGVMLKIMKGIYEQGDIQVISRRWVIKFFRNLTDVFFVLQES